MSSKKKAAAKKTPAPKAEKPAAEPAAPEKGKKGKAKKEGLPRPQLRVLAALADSDGPLTKAEVTAKAKINAGIIADAIGRFDAEARKKRDAELKRFSLLSAAFVRLVEVKAGEDTKAETRLEITEAGRDALAKALEELGGKLPKKQPAPYSKAKAE